MIKKIFNKLFKTFEKISFRETFYLTDMPIVTFCQGDKKFNFLLDTGSNDSIIDSNILSSVKHKIINEKSNLFGLEGEAFEVSMCKIMLTYKDQQYECPCLIRDMKKPFEQVKKGCGATLHGIIGSKFLDKYKYVIDFNELVAYSKK